MIIPIQAATMGFIPGGPYCIATMGLLKCGKTKGGRVRYVKIPKAGRLEIEHPRPIVDVTHLEVLISAMSDDIKKLKGRIINERELREVEEEILLMMELTH